MSTGAWIAIIAGAVILLLLLFAVVLPRMRARRHEHQLETRRGEVAEAHREVAAEREAKARLAESEAQRQRAEAEQHAARADLHERGLADDELEAERDPRTADDPQR